LNPEIIPPPAFPGRTMTLGTPVPPLWSDDPLPLTSDLALLRTGIVNLYLYGPPGAADREWVLIDAGLNGAAGAIERAAGRRFGPGARPSGIVLTHGHFDHVGALRELAERWDVPVWVHPLEAPYVTGRSAYPPPDPTVGGGAMAYLSWAYPRRPIDLGTRVHVLPEDGTVPGMPGWEWVHTPGHTPGHVSLFRASDRVLVAGDAVVTTKQESAVAAFTQRPEVHGPPAYFTPDWPSAARSVAALAALEPETLATGHGVPLTGPDVPEALHRLSETFERREVPVQGRYVGRPAVADERGVISVPTLRPATKAALGAGVVLLSGLALRSMWKR
jgi:glyoxylase-like metal-dependent hydrolase (beta-lactamase superfamily II)